MLAVGFRHADGSVEIHPRVALALRPLDAPFDLADVLQIVVEPRSVLGAQPAAQPVHVPGQRIEDASIHLPLRQPLLGGAGPSEQALEHHPRVDLHRQRRRGRRPRNRVHVRAGVAGAAAPDEPGEVFRGDLERGERRFLAEVLGDCLIDRDAGPDVFGLGRLRYRRRGPGGAGHGMVVPAGPIETAHHREDVAERLERLHDGLEREVGSGRRRRPMRRDDAVRHVHRPEAQAGVRCGAGRRRQRGHHGVEQRQRHAGPHPAQERPPGQRHLCNEHRSPSPRSNPPDYRPATRCAGVSRSSAGFIRIWNGRLLTTPRMISENR